MKLRESDLIGMSPYYNNTNMNKEKLNIIKPDKVKDMVEKIEKSSGRFDAKA